MSEPADEGPDLEAKSFTLADLRFAQNAGLRQGIESALVLIDAGATTAYVREHLLNDAELMRP